MLGPGAIDDNVDIRSEIKKIIIDEFRSIPVIYRRVRRDSNMAPIISPDRKDNRSGAPSLDIPSRDGGNIGYLFDDFLLYGFMPGDISEASAIKVIAAGQTKTESKELFLEYDCLQRFTRNNLDIPDEKDVIIFPTMDIEGKVISPLRASEYCRIKSVESFRLENYGRVEFFRLSLGVKEEKNFIL